MKLYRSICHLLIFLSLPSVVWSVPIEDLHQKEALLSETTDSSVLTLKSSSTEATSFLPPINRTSKDALFSRPSIQETSLNNENKATGLSKNTPDFGSDDDEFYLFEQDEIDKQQPGLGLYEGLSSMLSPEMKNDAKKIIAETKDLTEVINFSSKESDSKELVLQESSNEMILVKGKTLDELTGKNMPPALAKDKNVDKTLIRELFDGIYDVIKNGLIIIAGVLILGKLVNFIVKKLIINSGRRKKRKVRRRRKKRRHTYA